MLFLTDHDSVSGFPEAQQAAQGSGTAVYCGIEINTSQSDQVHILGYGFDQTNPAFLSRLEEFRERRVQRVRKIVANLNAHGLPVSFEDVKTASHETLGRPHVADALRRKGLVRSRQEAFNRFLVRGKPGYVDPMGPTPEEAIALIRGAGGFAVLAHPETVKGVQDELPRWIEQGLEGLETYYGAHSPSAINRFAALASQYGLISTGGSDFHGPESGRDKALGVEVPEAVFERFLERFRSCN